MRYGHQTWRAGGIKSTDSIQISLNDNDGVIIARSCDIGKTLYFSFRKGYVDQILAAGLATNTS